jgi:tripartite-type tricarboxylate transporter receptor subunit TctC
MDAIARTLGEQLSRKFGQPVIIENKPARAATSAWTRSQGARRRLHDGDHVDRDGHQQLPVREALVRPVKDFAPVSQLAVVPNMLVVNRRR